MQAAQHPTALEFQSKILTAGLDRQVYEFEQSTRSAQDAADAIGCELGQIVKSLIFKLRKSEKALIVLACGSNRTDEKKLRELIGEKLGKADAEFAREQTGYAIGGVPPFGHTSDLEIYMDRDLFQHELLWAAAGTPNSVFPISPRELERVSQAKVADIKVEVEDE